MRQFVVCGHDAPTTPEFPLDDLPSAAGRLDVLCRCVNSALFLSHGIRDEARVHLVLRDELTVSFDGGSVRRLNPDERSTAATIRNALEGFQERVVCFEGDDMVALLFHVAIPLVPDSATIILQCNTCGK